MTHVVPLPSKKKHKKLVCASCQAKFYKNEQCQCSPTTSHNFPSVSYKSSTINYHDIDVFTNKKRSDNDENNKKRELIITLIVNNKIPSQYYDNSTEWSNLKKGVDEYIEQLCNKTNIQQVKTIECIPKAGRNHHYDFKIVINKTNKFSVEFKFNAASVNDTPQFVSPMKPSQYLESSYEDYYYNNYFKNLVEKYDLPLPTKEDYMKQIHSNKPECLKLHQLKYYCGCKKSSKYTGCEKDIEFYETAKKISHKSITTFITQYGLKKEKLSEYLIQTQTDKYYMLYKDNTFHLETINLDDYIITEIIKDPTYNRYKAKTKTGNELKILLRWKNGLGIAFPSFQIS